MIKTKILEMPPKKIFQCVCKTLEIEATDILECDGSDKYILIARDLAIYYLSNYSPWSYETIANFLNLTSRHAPYAATKKIERALKSKKTPQSLIKTYSKKIEKNIENM